MASVADIQACLTGWPDEVVEEWILYFVNDGLGWPPPDPYGDHRWGRILGQRQVAWWTSVQWRLEKADFAVTSLAPKSKGIVEGIIDAVDNRVADEGTARRFRNAFHYVLDNASLPNAISAMRTPEGLLLLDGSHRLSAFCSLQRMPEEWFANKGKKKPELEQPIWIGTHPQGELPLT
ncbi:MAG: hypothetical protein ACO1SX_23825 [Actinomycetota bacterium]